MKSTSYTYSLGEIGTAVSNILALLKHSNIICFYGEMAAGKTTLIKAIGKQLGVLDEITSPTFSIVNEYITNTKNKIYHFDFYRLTSEKEAFDLGYEDYFYSKYLCLIEWPEKISNIIPPNHLKVKIEKVDDTSRRLVLCI